jgi:hypothetical protein
MPEKAVYLLVVDGFADWEPAHAIAELRRCGNYRIESVGLTRDPVSSMGGLRVFEELNALSADDRESWTPIFRSGRMPQATEGARRG